ncbi:MAG: proline dehydrogenase family protein [Ginsengibacter sp.]
MKLVRGVYMEKERSRADELNYNSPVNETKQDTDDEFNAALEFCINPVNGIHIIIGPHNENSNLYATQLMAKSELSTIDP